MFTLRCTHKLLRRGSTESPHGEVAPTTLLGDWYAHVLVTRPQHLVLCVSERTLLPVIVPAKSAGTLPPRLLEALPPIPMLAHVVALDLHRRGRLASSLSRHITAQSWHSQQGRGTSAAQTPKRRGAAPPAPPD